MADSTDRLPPAADAPNLDDELYDLAARERPATVSPPRSSRKETPKDSPVPLDVEAARELVPGWTMAEIVQVLNDCADEEDDRCFLNFYKAAPMLRSLASSLSWIAELKRDAERLDYIIRQQAGLSDVLGEWWVSNGPSDERVILGTGTNARGAIDAARLASDSGTGD